MIFILKWDPSLLQYVVASFQRRQSASPGTTPPSRSSSPRSPKVKRQRRVTQRFEFDQGAQSASKRPRSDNKEIMFDKGSFLAVRADGGKVDILDWFEEKEIIILNCKNVWVYIDGLAQYCSKPWIWDPLIFMKTWWGTNENKFLKQWVQCGADITRPIFSKIFMIDNTPYFVCEGWLFSVFCKFKLWWWSFFFLH